MAFGILSFAASEKLCNNLKYIMIFSLFATNLEVRGEITGCAHHSLLGATAAPLRINLLSADRAPFLPLFDLLFNCCRESRPALQILAIYK
jgi:hypothetical protein